MNENDSGGWRSGSGWNWEYDQLIPSDPDAGVHVIRCVLDHLEQCNWNQRDIFSVHMAIEEAVMNAIKHGNRCDPNKCVHVLVKASDTEFYAKITDQGCGFDPMKIRDPTADENLERPCGRGVMLMRHFMDFVAYNADGNSVEIAKTKSTSE
jgi:serine/threonine-protein kinase RsbW